MGDYSPGQMATMSSAIAAAQSALKAQNFSKLVSAINNYYSAQSYIPGTTTVQRGYAQAALNQGRGVFAARQRLRDCFRAPVAAIIPDEFGTRLGLSPARRYKGG